MVVVEVFVSVEMAVCRVGEARERLRIVLRAKELILRGIERNNLVERCGEGNSREPGGAVSGACGLAQSSWNASFAVWIL